MRSIIFCGSFLEYSATVLRNLLLHPDLSVDLVVTTPPHQNQKNPVHLLAEEHNIPVITPAKLVSAADHTLPDVDFVITAGYGKLLPKSWLQWPNQAALNLHFSYLPEYRGANPAEWALLLGEEETGISIITMKPAFDTGDIVYREQTTISPEDNRVSIYDQLYQLGGERLADVVAFFGKPDATEQAATATLPGEFFDPAHTHQDPTTPYAERLMRDDGFVSWQVLETAMAGTKQTFHELETKETTLKTIAENHASQVEATTFIERATRALATFPSLWTKIPTQSGHKRMKVIEVSISTTNTIPQLVLEKVHIAGIQPTPWNQVKNQLKK